MTKPLRIFGLVGLGAFVPGLMICASLVVGRVLFGQPLADRPLLLLGILLTVVGAQFVSIGILAEIQIRTYHESANKSIYLVREILSPYAMEKVVGEISPVGAHTIRSKNAKKMLDVQTG